MLGIFGDVIVELEGEAVLLEGTNPFMRGDEHVGPFTDAEHLQQLQRVIVEPFGRALAHDDLDAFRRPLGLQFLVQSLRRLDDVAGPQRS